MNLSRCFQRMNASPTEAALPQQVLSMARTESFASSASSVLSCGEDESSSHQDCSTASHGDDHASHQSADQSRMSNSKHVPQACFTCYRGKKKCDMQRPCGRCVKFGREGTCCDRPKLNQGHVQRSPQQQMLPEGRPMLRPTLSNESCSSFYSAPMGDWLASTMSLSAAAPLPSLPTGNSNHNNLLQLDLLENVNLADLIKLMPSSVAGSEEPKPATTSTTMTGKRTWAAAAQQQDMLPATAQQISDAIASPSNKRARTGAFSFQTSSATAAPMPQQQQEQQQQQYSQLLSPTSFMAIDRMYDLAAAQLAAVQQQQQQQQRMLSTCTPAPQPQPQLANFQLPQPMLFDQQPQQQAYKPVAAAEPQQQASSSSLPSWPPMDDAQWYAALEGVESFDPLANSPVSVPSASASPDLHPAASPDTSSASFFFSNSTGVSESCGSLSPSDDDSDQSLLFDDLLTDARQNYATELSRHPHLLQYPGSDATSPLWSNDDLNFPTTSL